MAGRLIVEHLDGETLVYDTQKNEAHALAGAGAAEFLAAESEVSRREVLRKLALAGVAAAGTGALVKTIVAPSPAHAQSPTACVNAPGGTCAAGTTCCVATVTSACCTAAQQCCVFGGLVASCCTNPTTTCIGGLCAAPSDRNLKHHLAPVGPQDVLGALTSR
jgi:hypothetical protein